MKQRESGVYDAISPKQQPLSNFRYSQRIRGVEIGLKEVEKMLPEVNKCVREEFPVSELVLGVKCGSSDGFSPLRIRST